MASQCVYLAVCASVFKIRIAKHKEGGGRMPDGYTPTNEGTSFSVQNISAVSITKSPRKQCALDLLGHSCHSRYSRHMRASESGLSNWSSSLIFRWLGAKCDHLRRRGRVWDRTAPWNKRLLNYRIICSPAFEWHADPSNRVLRPRPRSPRDPCLWKNPQWGSVYRCRIAWIGWDRNFWNSKCWYWANTENPCS